MSYLIDISGAAMNFPIDASALFSIVLGVIGLMIQLPVVSVLGAALGINAVFKERSMTHRRPVQFVMGLIGCVICAVGIANNLIQKLTG
jgi:Sec-independent protein secretion pathway component TatC